MPFFFFTSCVMASTTKVNYSSVSCSLAQKSTVFIFKVSLQSTSNEFPENAPEEKYEISSDDIEDVVDTFIIKNIVFYASYITPYSVFLPINYKESGNMQCHREIVPPPPKL